MYTLLVRTAIIYILVFIVLRLMGKRQISDMQPFDLVITLLIADVASEPVSDVAIPLLYGVIPILTLFILHRLVAFLVLRSNKLRKAVCGKPIIVIAKGLVLEDAMRAANYSLGDLTEQLRLKDVFSISEVAYGILETNGSLSVLKKQADQTNCDRPSVLLLSDGKPDANALQALGYDRKWLRKQLDNMGKLKESDCLFAALEPDGRLHVQEKIRKRSKAPSQYYKAVN